ncbi:PREDICTED: transcription termination factor 1, partial [Thamnophis sirtalis]|uniref:Transcription termination factor 1 n=1 Tax=Thamnophis sirtalis TaxID=35019 RepID=A0A6I9YPD3_9SAUR
MDKEDTFLVEDTQLSIYEKKRKKSRKGSWEEQPIVSSDQICYSSQDTEDFVTRRKKHKKKKTSSETSDASWVIPETPLIDESEINDFVPKKKKKKKKHRHKHGSEDECGSPSTPTKTCKLSPKKASENRGDTAVGDEFCSASTPQKPSKLSPKKTLENGGDGAVGDEFRNRSIPKKSSKRSKASENGGDTAVGDEFCSASTPQKPIKLSQKKTSENAGDGAVGDEFRNGSTLKKSSKRSKASENGGDTAVGDEFCSASTPQKPSKLSPKKTSENGGDTAVGDEFRSVSTPRKSSKLPRKEDLENGSGVESNTSSHKKKKRKRRMSCVPDGPTEEKAEVTRSPREGQVDLDETIDTQMDLFASSPLSFSEGPQVGLLPRDDQEGSHSPTAENSDATQVDLEMEGTSAGDHGQEQPPSPSQSLTSEVDKKSVQSRMGRKRRSSRKQPPSETYSEEEEEEDVYALSKEQLENDRKELEEYIPRAKTMSDSAIRQLAILDLSRFRELKKKGMVVRFGVFSQAENDLLTENVEAFLEESGIETPEKLLFAHRFPEEQAEIKRRKCQYQFCERIARGIARPWRLVYYRARKMFDPQNYNGRYTKKEEKKLFKYHAMYGNNWKKISELMNRSSHSIALKYSLMVEDFNLGPWTKEEISRLLKAIQDILKTRVKGLENKDGKETLTLLRESLYKNIRWVKV